MEPKKISPSQARAIILDAAGLASPIQFGLGIDAVYKLISHLGFVQLDTNYVVERAHHHVMFARIPDYDTRWLAELVEDGRVFEYFTSDAGYLPMEDFRFSLCVKDAFKNQGDPVSKPIASLMRQILDRVERDGSVMVGDFDNDRLEASSGWWDWRPAKVALEKLYLEGNLMITRDKKFHKRYELPSNLVPQEIDMTLPTSEEFARFIVRRTLGALGISSIKEMLWRARRVKGNLVKTELDKMVEEGEVLLVAVEDIKGPLYMLSNQKIDIKLQERVLILSPFDILNVFRHRLKDFFNFDYQIECFVPAHKRLYGYFSLPVLAGDTFIARMDAKADRKKKVLLIHNIHFEEVDLSENVLKQFISSIKAFSVFNHCHDVVFSKSNNVVYLGVLLDGFM